MSRNHLFAATAALALMTSQAFAHRQWMLPSATVLSVKDGWVTIDAAVSNELFYFDHVPLRLTNLVITAPDLTKVQAENASTGKYRSTFDLHLTQPGTYRVSLLNDTAMASWKENGQVKSWRGPAAELEKSVPAGAEELRSARMTSRVELFVTSGKPSAEALRPSGAGLELVPVTHPNDLVSGEAATFQMLLHGKPAANLVVSVIPGGIRYRDQLNEVKVTTGADGKFSVTFPAAGMYWLNATAGAAGRGAGGPMGDRANYVATLEVLPQ